jgi:hypothetical protein
MFPDDKENLKRILMSYSSKELLKELVAMTLDAAGNYSDIGDSQRAKEYTNLSVSLEDLSSGRPFLV